MARRRSNYRNYSKVQTHFYFGFKNCLLFSVIFFIFIAFVSPNTADKILYILERLLSILK